MLLHFHERYEGQHHPHVARGQHDINMSSTVTHVVINHHERLTITNDQATYPFVTLIKMSVYSCCLFIFCLLEVR